MAISTTPPSSTSAGILCSTTPRQVIPTKVNISHVQLRSLIICPNQSGIVNYIQDRAIVEHDFNEPGCATNPPRPLIDLHFTPNTLAGLHLPSIGRTLYAAGGQEAELNICAVRESSQNSRSENSWFSPRRSVEFTRESNLNTSINNSVLLISSGDDHARPEPQVIVSNNDCSVRFFNIAMGYGEEDVGPGRTLPPDSTKGSIEKNGRIQFPVAVNHSSISPDKRTLLSVGDSPHIHLTRLTPGGSAFSSHPITTIHLPPTPYTSIHSSSQSFSGLGHGYGYGYGASFSTAFSYDGSKYAVASQDGLVAAWDVRSTTPLKTWSTFTPSPSAQSPTISTADDWNRPAFASKGPPWSVRSVAFSKGKGGKEIMAFTEHSSGKVHVVDARTFEAEQIIEVPTPEEVPSNVQALLARRQAGLAMFGSGRREVERIIPDDDERSPIFYELTDTQDDEDMEIDAYPPVPSLPPPMPPFAVYPHNITRGAFVPLRLARTSRQPLSTLAPATPRTSPTGLDLAGLCFDPSGSKMYVASTGSVSEWDILGTEKKWFYDDGWA